MWIENFRTLKNANLNFHANFEFEFEPIKTEEVKHPNGEKEESVKEGKLKIKKFTPNDEFIHKYFPDNQFISLIVGKNGTGKTSILELLNTLKNGTRYIALLDFDKKSKKVIEKYKIENKFFCIFLDNDNKKLFFWGAIIHKENKGKIRFVEFNEISEVKEFTLKLPSKEIYGSERKTDLENTYFSLNDYKIQTHLLAKESKEWWQKPLLGASWGEDFKSNYLKDNESFLKNLFKCKNINIISEILSIDKYTKFPDYFIIKVPYLSLIKGKKPYDFDSFFKEINELQIPKKELIKSSIEKLKILHKIIFEKELEPIVRIKVILFIHAFLEYIDRMIRDYSAWKNFIENEEFERFFKKLETIRGLEKNTEIKDLIKDLYEHYKSIELRVERIVYTSIINESLEKIEQFLSFLKELMEDEEKAEQKETDDKILIWIEIDKYKNDEKFLEKIGKLVDSYLALKLYSFNPIELNFYPAISPGQKSLLSVFADISELLDGDNCSNVEKEENIILLLDEPDVFFHPEWQRLFIYFLTEFLKKKYSNKDFHVIISTHSPFMLSDIPKGNCVFLELDIKENEKGKIQEYKAVVKPKEKVSDTLAQNIYYLLADGFFMEKGIGEYINNCLKQFLSKIGEETLNPEEEKEFRYLIENIGDTVLRNKLLQIVENKNFYKGKLKV